MGSSKSSKSSKPSDISVPLILSFVAGFVTSRVMNNQDVITGSSVEGQDNQQSRWDRMSDGQRVPLVILIVIVVGLFFVAAGHGAGAFNESD